MTNLKTEAVLFDEAVQAYYNELEQEAVWLSEDEYELDTSDDIAEEVVLYLTND